MANGPSGGSATCNSNINGTITNTNQLTTTGNHTITCTVTTGANKQVSVSKVVKITYDPYTITNLIVNGSFEKGIENWSAYNGTEDSAVVVNNGYHGNYALRFNHKNGTEYLAVVYQMLPESNQHAQHKYYGAEYIRSDSNYTSADTSLEIYRNYKVRFNDNTVPTSKWSKTSNVVTLTDEQPNWHIRMFAQWPSNYLYIDTIILIDLTEAFGAGNEPDKEWCDRHINYFDGTAIIYK